MKCKNIEMEQMIAALQKHLGRTDIIGYAAARNTRILREECAEYMQRREQLIEKHGEPETDEDGNQTGRKQIRIGSDAFNAYAKEIEEWALIEHEPDLFTVPLDKAIGILSGQDMLDLEWMLDGWGIQEGDVE